jgi:hypothetical protein
MNVAIQFHSLIHKSLTPLVFVSVAASVVCSIFIVDISGWGGLYIPVILSIAGGVIFPVALFPAAFFSGVMQTTEKTFPRVSKAAAVLSLGYIAAFISGVSAFIISSHAALFLGPHAVLMAGWSLAAAVMPWAVFALRDRKNTLFIMMIWMLIAGVCASFVSLKGQRMDFWPVFGVIFAVMSVLLALQAAAEKLMTAKT